MSILENELAELKKYATKVISDCILETCVPAMVRAVIQPTLSKQIVACFQFTPNYPYEIVLLELKSKHISQNLLDKLSKVCESEIKQYIGKPQVLHTLRFIRKFIVDNPLCCCYEEISDIRHKLKANDELKLKQKSSSLILKVVDGDYFLKCNIIVPDEYPGKQVRVEEIECNFPSVFRQWFFAQSAEIARQCIVPPVKSSSRDPQFVIKPSLDPVILFLIDEVHNYPNQICKVCNIKAFPNNPKDVATDEASPIFIERIYCGHIYHGKCLDTYIKAPPFQKRKVCHTCRQDIYHFKWKLTPQLAEQRWAHKEAKRRELDEVVDFLNI